MTDRQVFKSIVPWFMHTYVAKIHLGMNKEGQTMIEEHSDHSKRGIENARFGVVPNDVALDKLI